MALSVNTNVGAMVALQNLAQTNRELAMTQNRVATGLAVAGPKDNGAFFQIAQGMRGDVAGWSAIQQNVGNAVSVADTAIAGGKAISDLLVEIKGKIVAAQGADTDSVTALQAEVDSMLAQIVTIADNASFNGVNLINTGATDFDVLTNPNGNIATDKITITAQGFEALGAAIADVSVAGAITTINTRIDNATAYLSQLGTEAKSLEIHRTFAASVKDALNAGIGNLVDADLAEESAKLQSLQIKQQLGVQALSIANQGPAAVLGLFR